MYSPTEEAVCGQKARLSHSHNALGILWPCIYHRKSWEACSPNAGASFSLEETPQPDENDIFPLSRILPFLRGGDFEAEQN